MSALEGFLNFIYDNFQLVWNNKIIFIIWAIMCGGVGYSISSKRIGQLKKEKQNLENEINTMKKLYSQLTPEERLLMGENEPEFSPSAEAVSREVRTKKVYFNRRRHKK